MKTNKSLKVLYLLIVALILRYFGQRYLSEEFSSLIRIVAVFVTLVVGALYVLRGTASIIEETTEVFSERTRLAAGLLQSLGTAFPDLVLGIVAALVSLKLREADYALAVNYAIIAASTTFGSNIYNIGFAAWCLVRQNHSNQTKQAIPMFPLLKNAGTVRPFIQHKVKPTLDEINISIKVSTALTLLTSVVALSMVIFGAVEHPPAGFKGDLYQLIRPIGFLVFALSCVTMYVFRETKRAESPIANVTSDENYYRNNSMFVIWTHLLVAGGSILLAAESMIKAIETFSTITHTPFVVVGILAGLIGCLGEIIVIYNFTINPQGRIGDAVTGVAMDNIVTILGAAIVAMFGGIFLGGNALILVFVVIFALNTVLISQLARLKDYLVVS